MLVSRIIGDCPKCGGIQKYGNVSVIGNEILRGCLSCNYRKSVWLPEIRKKIIYLDQFFFSSAFRDQDERFVQAAEKIRYISDLQLLVAPFSSVHEDETHQWRGFDGKNKDDLMEFIKATSRGHEFEPAYGVERKQIIRAFKAFLNRETEAFQLLERDAVDKRIHEWDNYIRIDVAHYFKDTELIRALKKSSIESLVDIFPEWRQSTNSYDQDLALEFYQAAKTYIDSYIEYMVRIAKGDNKALLDAPIISRVVESMLHRLLNDDVSADDGLKIVGDFFRSAHFTEIPYQSLRARIYVALKDMVKRGAYQNRFKAIQRLGGFFQDVDHINTYAPYCDAFVMDQAMTALVPVLNWKTTLIFEVYIIFILRSSGSVMREELICFLVLMNVSFTTTKI